MLGTVAWTVVADRARAQAATARTVVADRARAQAATARTALRQAAYQHALAAGFDRAFLVASGIALLILVVAIAAIRVRRADLSGASHDAPPHQAVAGSTAAEVAAATRA